MYNLKNRQIHGIGLTLGFSILLALAALVSFGHPIQAQGQVFELEIAGPTQVTSGQAGSWAINLSNNGLDPVRDIQLTLSFAPPFELSDPNWITATAQIATYTSTFTLTGASGAFAELIMVADNDLQQNTSTMFQVCASSPDLPAEVCQTRDVVIIPEQFESITTTLTSGVNDVTALLDAFVYEPVTSTPSLGLIIPEALMLQDAQWRNQGEGFYTRNLPQFGGHYIAVADMDIADNVEPGEYAIIGCLSKVADVLPIPANIPQGVRCDQVRLQLPLPLPNFQITADLAPGQAITTWIGSQLYAQVSVTNLSTQTLDFGQLLSDAPTGTRITRDPWRPRQDGRFYIPILNMAAGASITATAQFTVESFAQLGPNQGKFCLATAGYAELCDPFEFEIVLPPPIPAIQVNTTGVLGAHDICPPPLLDPISVTYGEPITICNGISNRGATEPMSYTVNINGQVAQTVEFYPTESLMGINVPFTPTLGMRHVVVDIRAVGLRSGTVVTASDKLSFFNVELYLPLVNK